MTSKALLIELRWPGGRFHGTRQVERRGRTEIGTEWPPSPFRLYQALVGAAYGGRWASEDATQKDEALQWLEALPPPLIGAAEAHALPPVTYFVPNNDLDAVGGDPANVSKIRAAKRLHTRCFDPDSAVAYLWRFDGDDTPAQRIAELAERLHTLGHGMDAAFADAQVIDADDGEARLRAIAGAPRRPAGSPSNGAFGVPCPTRGSLVSLKARHRDFRHRLERKGKKVLFRQPRRAHSRAVAYDRAPDRLLYELTPLDGARPFAPWLLTRAVALTEAVRSLLEQAHGKARRDLVERFIVGRNATGDDIVRRLRIVPLPSTGMIHTDPAIRRVLIEVPPEHPFSVEEIEWALGGHELHASGGAPLGIVLTRADDLSMLRHYGVGARNISTEWMTVTPAALPERAARRRIDPARLKTDPAGEVKSGSERAAEEARAASAVLTALRHAGVATPALSVRVQREPFEMKGERAEPFAEGTRFAKERLWHVAIAFEAPVAGPLIIGDGRFLGLGLMRPVRTRKPEAGATA